MSWEFVNTLFGPDIVNTAPKCRVPGCNNYADNAGNGKYHRECTSHHKEKYKMGDWIYKQYRKDYCENEDGRLGYKCHCNEDIQNVKWQLTVDHIDGDRNNNHPSNLQTLSLNCHAYKTMINEENLPMNKRKKFLEEKHREELESVGYFTRLLG